MRIFRILSLRAIERYIMWWITKVVNSFRFITSLVNDDLSCRHLQLLSPNSSTTKIHFNREQI